MIQIVTQVGFILDVLGCTSCVGFNFTEGEVSICFVSNKSHGHARAICFCKQMFGWESWDERHHVHAHMISFCMHLPFGLFEANVFWVGGMFCFS